MHMVPTDAKQWVNYLSQFGPSSSNDNLYDEKLAINLKKLRVNPIEIDSPFDTEVIQTINKLADSGKSGVILLAGMAGDGKTRTARYIWNKLSAEINGRAETEKWNSDRFPTLNLTNSVGQNYTVSFVKDLSHRLDTDPTGIDDPMSITEIPERTCRIIACNHGRLLEHIRKTKVRLKIMNFQNSLASTLEKLFFSKTLKKKIENVLPDIDVYLFDLSVYNPADKFEAIITEVYGRQEWQNCKQCPCYGKCPIMANRNALWDDIEHHLKTPATRQTELIRLITSNGTHLPIRDLLIVAINNLLGMHSLNENAPRKKKLLSCNLIAEANGSALRVESYIFSNLLGNNLPGYVKKDNLIFKELAQFNIGGHAPRVYDKFLTAPELLEKIKPFVETTAAKNLWDLSQSVEDKCSKELLRMRRQAAFFSLPENEEIDRWQMTAFSYGKEYSQLTKQPNSKKLVERQLVIGMNRVFTGQFRNEDSQIFITTAGTDSKSTQGELLLCTIPVRPRTKRGKTQNGIFIISDSAGQLKLCFIDDSAVETELTPSLYEFFRRQAKGYVISGFTKNCRSQAMQLKTRLIKEFSDFEDDFQEDLPLNLLPMLEINDKQIVLEINYD